MDLANPSGLTLALVLLVPGFVSMKVWEVIVPSERRDLTTSSLEAFAFGSLNFAVLAGPLLALGVLGSWETQHPLVGYLMWLAVLFVAPASWPMVIRELLKSRWLKGHVVHPTPKPWDYVFGHSEEYWVVLHLKDGRRIGGRYATHSFASSFPNDEQVYLEEVWELDDRGAFLRKVDRSRGIMVSFQDAHALELFSGEGEDDPSKG